MFEQVLDSSRMWEYTAGLPEQVALAAINATATRGLPLKHEIENVVVLGMGGSGIAGDVLLAVAAPFMSVPVAVVKAYTIPAYVGHGSLVFAISFSGNTEETIDAAAEALRHGARVVFVTSGGELAQLARDAGEPLISVPSDIPQPRAAIGAMSVPPLVVLEEIGLFPGATHWIDLAVAQLQRRRDALIQPRSEIESIAERIGDSIPLIHSSGAIGRACAQRWKTQINENAKRPAFYSVYSENCHNELAGWEYLNDLTTTRMTVVNLRHPSEHPQVVRRFDIAHDLMGSKVKDIIAVRGVGEGELSQLLDLVLTGDFVSLQIAKNDGIDPGPIPVLNEMKSRLSGR
ncbi:MAG: bifunctional phosphoglucose/phosphomannose isomerase [Actinomycetota bacterium]|nr:MAG: bifunctional phosphoglucose/phosphomannose isomerase [Actinomycetota bacterium]